MPYTQAAHPIIWEISHHPMVVLLLSLVVVVVVGILFYGTPTPGSLELTDMYLGA
jgi:hypothetical protein